MNWKNKKQLVPFVFAAFCIITGITYIESWNSLEALLIRGIQEQHLVTTSIPTWDGQPSLSWQPFLYWILSGFKTWLLSPWLVKTFACVQWLVIYILLPKPQQRLELWLASPLSLFVPQYATEISLALPWMTYCLCMLYAHIYGWKKLTKASLMAFCALCASLILLCGIFIALPLMLCIGISLFPTYKLKTLFILVAIVGIWFAAWMFVDIFTSYPVWEHIYHGEFLRNRTLFTRWHQSGWHFSFLVLLACIGVLELIPLRLFQHSIQGILIPLAWFLGLSFFYHGQQGERIEWILCVWPACMAFVLNEQPTTLTSPQTQFLKVVKPLSFTLFALQQSFLLVIAALIGLYLMGVFNTFPTSLSFGEDIISLQLIQERPQAFLLPLCVAAIVANVWIFFFKNFKVFFKIFPHFLALRTTVCCFGIAPLIIATHLEQRLPLQKALILAQTQQKQLPPEVSCQLMTVGLRNPRASLALPQILLEQKIQEDLPKAHALAVIPAQMASECPGQVILMQPYALCNTCVQP